MQRTRKNRSTKRHASGKSLATEHSSRLDYAEKMLEVLNREASTARNVWITFISLLTFVAITVAGVTHQDLFFEKALKIPLLNVDLPLTWFFAVAPLLIVVLHARVLLEHALLAAKAHEVHRLLNGVPQVYGDRLRQRASAYFFVQETVLPNRSKIINSGVRFISSLTLEVFPLALLVFIQLQFLAYQHDWLTWLHRLLVLASASLVVSAKAANGPISLLKISPSYSPWLQKTSWWVEVLKFPLIAVAISFFLATAANERGRFYDFTRIQWDPRVSTLYEPETFTYLDAISFGALNLPNISIEHNGEGRSTTRDFSNRSFVGANFSNSKLAGANFSGSNFNGAKFEDADLRLSNFGCIANGVIWLPRRKWHEDYVDQRPSEETIENFYRPAVGDQLTDSVFARLRCTSLKKANLRNAKLMLSDFSHANLSFANFFSADLRGAELQDAVANGAIFDYAMLSEVKSLSSAVLASFKHSLILESDISLISTDAFGRNPERFAAADFRNSHMVLRSNAYALRDSILEGTPADLRGVTFYSFSSNVYWDKKRAMDFLKTAIGSVSSAKRATTYREFDEKEIGPAGVYYEYKVASKLADVQRQQEQSFRSATWKVWNAQRIAALSCKSASMTSMIIRKNATAADIRGRNYKDLSLNSADELEVLRDSMPLEGGGFAVFPEEGQFMANYRPISDQSFANSDADFDKKTFAVKLKSGCPALDLVDRRIKTIIEIWSKGPVQ
jgi:uncharacterized protein YjbI with pentapeptide repeats